jgi:glycosyltransferase involved in cell wall biosynthesis
MLGARGVPASYGGFETCVEEVGKRLAAAGHEVTVYCRSSHYAQRPPTYAGMRLVYLPSIRSKSLDTFTHTTLSALHALGCAYDMHFVFIAANSPFVIPLRLAGRKIALNPDGLEWQRAKWGPLGRAFFKFGERAACLVAHRIIADCPGIRDYYLRTYGVDSEVIAYGASIQECPRPTILGDFGVESGRYFLQITRFEPENHPLLTIEAFRRLDTDMKLLLVGGTPYDTAYARKVRAAGGDRVLLPGYIYDQDILRQLWCNCHAYVHGNSVGGTNPALLQSMASGCFTLALDVAFNRDVLGDAGIYFRPDAENLARAMRWSLDHGSELAPYKAAAIGRIRANYDWDDIARKYEELARNLARA